ILRTVALRVVPPESERERIDVCASERMPVRDLHRSGVVGDQVTARARLVKISGRKIFCAVEAANSKEKIGEGTQVQMLVRKDRLERLSNPARATGSLHVRGRS
ncbi:MAG TPA: hypothetical protein VNA31_04165, partial [bacterium]|nr:hypothetical protein [bacterium]